MFRSKRFEYPTTTTLTKDDESMRNSTACLTKYDGDEYNNTRATRLVVLRKKTNYFYVLLFISISIRLLLKDSGAPQGFRVDSSRGLYSGVVGFFFCR